jgi:long-chain acyl-CoA synthetase
MSVASTLPRLLRRNAAQWPDRPAWRHKRLGIWQTLTWSGFAALSGDLALGLAAQGFGPGDRLAVLGDNRPELYAALLAAQTLGGVGVPLDPDAPPARLAAILTESGPRVLVVDTEDEARRLPSLVAALPRLPALVCVEASGLGGVDGEVGLAALVAAGRDAAAGRPDPFPALLGSVMPEDGALLLYPAGEGPPPAPAMLCHKQLLDAAETIANAYPVGPGDDALCYLSMASYEDATYSLALGLLAGFACNCPEASDDVPRDLREIGPTILCAPPAACEALARIVAVRAQAASPLKRRIFGYFRRLALQAEALREQGRDLPLGLGLRCRLGEIVVFAPARDQLGLSRARWVLSGTPVPAEPARLLRALGVALRSGPRLDFAEPVPRHGEAARV